MLKLKICFRVWHSTVYSLKKSCSRRSNSCNESLKDLQGIENMTSSRIADVGGYGMLDRLFLYSKKQEDKDVNDLIKKMNYNIRSML